ncbi:MAG: hypothetical protein AB1921_02695 [Thermodesulfobacteriota bacterium]
MEPNDARLRAGLTFFGRITANMTHEIKNVLAVINEISGLFSDLCTAAERGRPLDPAQLARLSGKMCEQIQRADGVVKRLNRFAHSVDSPCQAVDLQEMLELFSNLTRRLSEQKSVTVTVRTSDPACTCGTDHYGLLLLLFLGLEMVWENVEKGSSVTLFARGDKDSATVGFECPVLRPLAPNPEKKLFWDSWLAKMNATAAAPGKSGALEITLPRGLV